MTIETACKLDELQKMLHYITREATIRESNCSDYRKTMRSNRWKNDKTLNQRLAKENAREEVLLEVGQHLASIVDRLITEDP